MSRRTILVVDDESDMRILLKRSLEPDLDCAVITAASGTEALALLKSRDIDLMLADIRMPEMDGLSLLTRAKQEKPGLTVVIMTGHGTIETAVEAMKRGAWDFITKPFDHDTLVLQLEKALERSRLVAENIRLRQVCARSGGLEGIIGAGPAMQAVFDAVRMVAKTDLTVLITGESGTGKEMTARAVHQLSPRKDGPWIAVNCPTVPEQILESELFGYKKGAFTHAVRDRDGLFQEACGGSLFLDEIGEVSPTVQTRLLRVLQEKEIKPLGGNKTVKVDVRIIASTNRDLNAMIRDGSFREDFFYRLNVLPIHLPPLRERREDIPLIVDHLARKHASVLNLPPKRFSAEAMADLSAGPWQGNVRQLENTVIRSLLLSNGDVVETGDVRRAADGADGLMSGSASPGTDAGNAGPSEDALSSAPDKGAENGESGLSLRRDLPYKQAKEVCLQDFNRAYIGRLLRETGGNITRAAKSCGMERQGLQQVMRRYGLEAEQFAESGVP